MPLLTATTHLQCHHCHIFIKFSSYIEVKIQKVNRQYKYNDQLVELTAVFVEHSYEKVSVVKFDCLVKQFFGL